ncbi:MAG: TonB-dependent receptor [Candidatus Hydrogenedentes bacterium]|nr:TonB-dependent receptor [Candidatus Hydrogenedentota bacterium]
MQFVRTRGVMVWAVALAVGAASAWAGSITGTVKFEGAPPALKPLDTSADPVCAAKHKDKPLENEVLVLGPGQTMGNVLVRVSKGAPAKETPVPTDPVILTQEGCRYAPHVFAIRVGQPLKVLNPDGILHNVHSLPKANTAVNKAMPANVTEMDEKFTKVEEPFAFKCDIHPWMQAWCFVTDNPYYSITKADGVFTIDGLDPGDYEITAWHERLGAKTAAVSVKDGEPGKADFTFAKK